MFFILLKVGNVVEVFLQRDVVFLIYIYIYLRHVAYSIKLNGKFV